MLSVARAIGCVLALAIAAAAGATEGGGTSKALGVDTVRPGVMPQPGLRLTTFLAYYEADETLDGAGQPRPGLSDFQLDVTALTLRLQYVWPGVELWGANVETRLGASVFVDSSVSFDVQTPRGPLHREGSVTSWGDALFGPVLLGWHHDDFHQIFGLEFFIPTGRFDANKLANASRGYFSLGPAYFFTWLPGIFEVSGSTIYLVNARNPDTDYRSGDEVSLDYSLGVSPGRGWQFGLSGYLYKQVTDDRMNGRVVGDGNRGQAIGIGPFVQYAPTKEWGVTLKWHRETSVENRAKGDRIFLQFALQLTQR